MQHNGVSESNDFVGQESGSNLQDSEITIDSTDGEDNGAISNSGWLGSIGADFRSIANVAHCLTDNVKPVVSGVAALVHRTAVAVANEIALLEQDGELDHSSGDNLESLLSSPSHSAEKQQHEGLMLPWEIRRELSSIGEDNIPVYFTDNDLMDTILALSSHESTFLGPFKNHVRNIDDNSFAGDDKQISLTSFSSTFVMDESRIDLIGRLMDIDKNLASEHSRFSGKGMINEEVFWKNYFYHCEQVRVERLGCYHPTNHSSNKRTSPTKPAEVIETIANSANIKRRLDRIVSSIDDDDDGESLVPASEADDSSYVLPSAPNSVNTFTTTRSVDDVVFVNAPLNSQGNG